MILVTDREMVHDVIDYGCNSLGRFVRGLHAKNVEVDALVGLFLEEG